MPEVTQLVIKELWLNPCTPAPEYNACSNSNGERHCQKILWNMEGASNPEKKGV